MTMSDPLGDMLTRIRNGQSARKNVVSSPASKLRSNVLEVLKREGYIRGFTTAPAENVANAHNLAIELKYYEGEPVIRQIKGLSDNAFFNISCREADEILPNGENAHCSVHPHAWWMSRLRGQFPNVARTRAFSSDDLSAFTWGKSS